ncbi:hypothetical protein HDU99_002886 [Rhizoclosmatium hyalinum]|nr:hypothetical protein HDU99_002886 [Rhizoclosmatium hyalinum]
MPVVTRRSKRLTRSKQRVTPTKKPAFKRPVKPKPQRRPPRAVLSPTPDSDRNASIQDQTSEVSLSETESLSDSPENVSLGTRKQSGDTGERDEEDEDEEDEEDDAGDLLCEAYIEVYAFIHNLLLESGPAAVVTTGGDCGDVVAELEEEQRLVRAVKERAREARRELRRRQRAMKRGGTVGVVEEVKKEDVDVEVVKTKGGEEKKVVGSGSSSKGRMELKPKVTNAREKSVAKETVVTDGNKGKGCQVVMERKVDRLRASLERRRMREMMSRNSHYNGKSDSTNCDLGSESVQSSRRKRPSTKSPSQKDKTQGVTRTKQKHDAQFKSEDSSIVVGERRSSRLQTKAPPPKIHTILDTSDDEEDEEENELSRKRRRGEEEEGYIPSWKIRKQASDLLEGVVPEQNAYGEMEWTCPRSSCAKKYASKNALIYHLERDVCDAMDQDEESEAPVEPVVKTEASFQCKEEDLDKLYVCKECRKRYSNESSLRYHARSKHWVLDYNEQVYSYEGEDEDEEDEEEDEETE